MRHHVVVEIETDEIRVMEVQGRVIGAVEKAFQDRTGPLCVRGFDLKKFEAERATLLKEKDEYREAWLKEVAKNNDLVTETKRTRRRQ